VQRFQCQPHFAISRVRHEFAEPLGQSGTGSGQVAIRDTTSDEYQFGCTERGCLVDSAPVVVER
jgi:hypothetical protein